MTKPTVYIVDDDPAVRQAVSIVSKSLGFQILAFERAEDFLLSYDRTLACCLVLAVVLSNTPETETQTARTDVTDAEVLVTTWADSFAADMEDVPEIDERTDVDLNVPDWMLAGLTLNDTAEVNSTNMPTDVLQPGDMEL